MKINGADQPPHKSSLINAFVIHYLENIMSKLTIGEISIFFLVSLAEETGVSLNFHASLLNYAPNSLKAMRLYCFLIARIWALLQKCCRGLLTR